MASEATAGQTPDIYGQLHPVETPELLVKKHEEFLEELSKIAADKKKNVTLANEKCPELINDDFIRLFLRCEVFNTDLAVKRYVRYWDKRVEIFGPTRAFQPLTFDTMEPDEIIAMNIGYVTLIERPNDRTYIYVDPSKHDSTKYTRESMMRAIWIMIHSGLLKCALFQRRGLIGLSNPAKATMSQFDRKLDKLIMNSVFGCLPVRFSAVHICHPPLFFGIIWPIIKTFMPKRLRQRVHVHSGTSEHILNLLCTKYSFRLEDIPKDLNGKRDAVSVIA